MSEPKELDPRQAAEMVAGGAQLIDVREPYEHEAGHIDGAQHIELPELPSRAGELDRSRPVIFQCRIGARSQMAAQAFAAAGFDAYTLSGGLLAWVREGLPLVPQDGVVAPH